MGKGTKAATSYFNGAETGTVGKAQKGGASGGAGGKVGVMTSGGPVPHDKQPSGEKAGGTENTGADGKHMKANTSGPSVTLVDTRPAGVKVADGVSVPKSVSK